MSPAMKGRVLGTGFKQGVAAGFAGRKDNRG